MEDAKTVRYVSKDQIQNLKIRVTLWRLSVQKTKTNLTNPNATDPAQSQAQAQTQLQAQAQAMLNQQALMQQQLMIQQQQAGVPFPQPLQPQVYIGADGQPVVVPAGVAPPEGAVLVPPAVGPAGAATAMDPMAAAAAAQAAAQAMAAAGGALPPPPAGQGQVMDPQQQAAFMQQQLQNQQLLFQQQQQLMQQQQQPLQQGGQPQQQPQQPQQAQYTGAPGLPPQQQQQQQQQGSFPPQPPPGPYPAQALPRHQQAGQAVAESSDVAGPARAGFTASLRNVGGLAGGRGGRGRMPSQHAGAAAFDAAAPAAGAPAAGAPAGRHGLTAAAALSTAPRGRGAGAAVADPFAMLGPGLNPPGQRRGQPLGEADEGGDDGGGAVGRGGDGDRDSAGGQQGQQLQQRRRRGQRASAAGEADTGPAGGDAATAAVGQQGLAGAAPAAGGDPQAQAGTAQPAAAAAAPVDLSQPAPLTIPPQHVASYVPYGTLGPEARMAATGQPPDVPATTPIHLLPEKFATSRVFGWQEKVYSRTEIAASQAAAAAAAQAAGTPLPMPGLQHPGMPGMPGMPGQPPLAGQQPGAQPGTEGQAPRQNKRLQAFGSTSALNNKHLDPRTPGSLLFTYVQTDEFCEAQELGRTVTTSLYEEENLLVGKLLSNPKGRQQVLSFRCMYVMADLGTEGDEGGANHKVLVTLRAYPDGSFDMCPGFSRSGFKYRFEDNHGGIYEFMVENASATDVPSLEKRAAKLERAVVARAEELRRAAQKSDFEQPPGGQCTRLLLLADILSAADFSRDRLYIEYAVRWDPEVWDLSTPWPQTEPGIVQGVTHISRVTTYPADPARDVPARDVAHFCHPVELEWVSRNGPPPANKFPCMFFQVCTLDKLNRYTSEGYGWLSLDGRVPGSATHTVRTWKPLGTIRDLHAEHFVGGSAELADLAYLTTPSGFNGRILNKYGFKTETLGAIKVRLNTVAQRFNPDAAGARRAGGSPSPHRLPPGPAAAAAKRNQKKDMSLKMVVERARQRLREARGVDDSPGADVALRPGLVAEAPTIVVHPQDAVVAEEGTVRFKVVARGLPPLKYEWYKDDRRLVAATADQPELILVQSSLENEGTYYCQVSNKDGSVNSSKATLTVTREARVSRATAGIHGEAGGRTPPRPRQNRMPSGGPLSPGSSAGGSGGGAEGGGGGGRAAASRMSRLARLDAATTAAATPRGGSAGDGASEGGASAGDGVSAEGSTQRISATGAAPGPAAAGGEAPRPPLPPLPPPALQAAPSDGVVGGGLPPSVSAAASTGFRKRPSRAPSASGSAGGGSSGGGAAAAPGAGDGGGGGGGEVSALENVEEMVEAVPRPIVRRPSGSGQALPPPQQQATAARPAQQQPQRRNDDDDLEAEELE